MYTFGKEMAKLSLSAGEWLSGKTRKSVAILLETIREFSKKTG